MKYLFSVVFGKLEPLTLVEWVLEDKLKVRFQLQMHKFIWNPSDKRCVMKIAKEFNWEMGHRLPEHFGKCKNIHGHSYKMMVELEGDLDDEQEW